MNGAPESTPPVGEVRSTRSARRRPWDVVKWVTFAIALLGAGAAAMGSIGGKADRSEVEAVSSSAGAAAIALDARVDTIERRQERLDADNAWIKSALWELTKHEGLRVPPPPKE